MAARTPPARLDRHGSEARTAAWQAASGALANVEQWLKHGKPSGVLLQDHEADPPKLNKGETAIDAIERLRRRGRELKADLHRIESAPYPSTYCKAQMRTQIEQLAMQGAPDISPIVEHDSNVIWSMQRVQSHRSSGFGVHRNSRRDRTDMLAAQVGIDRRGASGPGCSLAQASRPVYRGGLKKQGLVG